VRRVTLLWADLDRVPEPWLARLPGPFLDRCRAVADPVRGRRRAAARAFLETALATVTGRPQEAIRFGTGPHGKPFLEGGPPFSLADSTGLAVLAVGSAIEVGVDLERVRPVRRFGRIAARFLGEEAAADLADAVRRGAWDGPIAAWCRFEAWTKARGTGIAAAGPSPAGIHRPAPPPGRTLPKAPEAPDGWRLVDLDPPQGFRAALVAAGSAPVELCRAVLVDGPAVG